MDFHKLTIRALVALLLSLFISVQAVADEPVLAPSPELACLTRTSGSANKPDYPDDELELRKGARIPVSLLFTRPDTGPDVIIADHNSANDFYDAIKSYARNFRVPCMTAGDKPVTLKQEYHFDPFDGRKVMSSPLTDAADTARKAELACMTKLSDQEKFAYPEDALRHGEAGKYYIEMTFSAPDQGPSIKWVAASPSAKLKTAVAHYVENFRVPCLGDKPLVTKQLYHFILDDQEQIVIKDMSLKQFIMTSKDIPRPVSFNLNAMDCPFDVRVNYLRPFAKNEVNEIETTNPARKPLLDWLSLLTFAMSDAQNLKVLAEQFNVSIPCGSVDL